MPSIHTSNDRAHAYTLLEVLIVVVLMGLIASVLIPRLAGISDQADRNRLIAELVQLDAQARQLAQQGHWCMVRWDEGEHSLELVQGSTHPQTIRVAKLNQTQDLDHRFEPVMFDAFGRSQDYAYRLSDSRASIDLRFNGISGWHEVEIHED